MTGRFINADDTSILQMAQGELLGGNLYAYCGNCPVMNVDPSGDVIRTNSVFQTDNTSRESFYYPWLYQPTVRYRPLYNDILYYPLVPLNQNGRKIGRLNKYTELNEADSITVKTRFGTSSKMHKEAYKAWIAMQTAAKRNGVKISISFAYRSVAEQQRLYDAWIKYKKWVDGGKIGEAPPEANLAAKPTGPHQTGRAVDIFLNDDKIDSKPKKEQVKNAAYKWLKKYAFIFGFYGFDESKYDDNSMEFESWHWFYNP